MRVAILSAALLGLVLAGCGNQIGGNEGFETLAQVWKQRTTKAPAPKPITRASLGDFADPVLYAAIPKRNVESLLTIAMANRYATTWQTPDNITLTTRDGLLIETRGLGEDLMSAAVPDIRSVRGMAPRTLYHIGGDGATKTTEYQCQITAAGSETIDVLGINYRTVRVDEDCTSVASSLQNRYWIDGTGEIRQSLQWVSESVGYITLLRLID
jgi:hypothetical protein